MYKVIYEFADKLDKNYVYKVGDIYPREGVDVTDERIQELASNKNAIGKPVIEEVMPKPVEKEEAETESEPEVEAEREENAETEVEADEKPKRRK